MRQRCGTSAAVADRNRLFLFRALVTGGDIQKDGLGCEGHNYIKQNSAVMNGVRGSADLISSCSSLGTVLVGLRIVETTDSNFRTRYMLPTYLPTAQCDGSVASTAASAAANARLPTCNNDSQIWLTALRKQWGAALDEKTEMAPIAKRANGG